MNKNANRLRLLLHRSAFIVHPFQARHSTRRGACLTAPYPFVTIFAVSYLNDFFASYSRPEIKDMSTVASDSNYIGINVSGASLAAALVSHEGQVIARRDSALDAGDLSAQITRLVAALRDSATAPLSAL